MGLRGHSMQQLQECHYHSSRWHPQTKSSTRTFVLMKLLVATVALGSASHRCFEGLMDTKRSEERPTAQSKGSPRHWRWLSWCQEPNTCRTWSKEADFLRQCCRKTELYQCSTLRSSLLSHSGSPKSRKLKPLVRGRRASRPSRMPSSTSPKIT